jgi:hypothetical protein
MAVAESPAPVIPGEILHRAFVPSARRRHGEVRLSAASNQCVRVESVLFTSELARGFHRIHEEEKSLWPEGSDFHADSRRYLAALDAAREQIQKEILAVGDINAPVQAGARKHQVVIQFELRGKAGRIEIAKAELDGMDGDGPVQIVASTPLQTLDVPAEYVRRSFQRMLARAFDIADVEADSWVRDAGEKAGLNKP